MRNAPRDSLPFALLLLFLLPLPSLAMPAITCHCFTERTYDAARPAAADPYLLATTQNSFFAIVFNTDKKGIVLKKQQGTAADDLWIAYWVASKAGMSPETLLQAKQGHRTWKDVLTALQPTRHALGSRFTNALKAAPSSARLAEAVVDELFLHHQLLAEAELAAARRAGASNQELIMATLVAARTGRAASQVYRDVKSGSKTWGALLLWAEIDTKNLQREIAVALKLHPK